LSLLSLKGVRPAAIIPREENLVSVGDARDNARNFDRSYLPVGSFVKLISSGPAVLRAFGASLKFSVLN
jgi:hypothetical protein